MRWRGHERGAFCPTAPSRVVPSPGVIPQRELQLHDGGFPIRRCPAPTLRGLESHQPSFHCAGCVLHDVRSSQQPLIPRRRSVAMSEPKATANQLVSLAAGGFAGGVEAMATVRFDVSARHESGAHPGSIPSSSPRPVRSCARAAARRGRRTRSGWSARYTARKAWRRCTRAARAWLW